MEAGLPKKLKVAAEMFYDRDTDGGDEERGLTVSRLGENPVLPM